MNTSPSQISIEDFIMNRADPDQLGEFLRSFIFVGAPGELGCYSTFDTIDPIRTLDESERIGFWETVSNTYHLDEEDATYDEIQTAEEDNRELAELSKAYAFQVGEAELTMGYLWDGDGTLAFSVNYGDDRRAVINTDCKKTYRWQNAFNRSPVSWML